MCVLWFVCYRATQLGAKGKQLGILKKGGQVEIEGRVVKSEECVGPSTPGKKIVFLQVPFNAIVIILNSNLNSVILL